MLKIKINAHHLDKRETGGTISAVCATTWGVQLLDVVDVGSGDQIHAHVCVLCGLNISVVVSGSRGRADVCPPNIDWNGTRGWTRTAVLRSGFADPRC